MKEFVVRKNIHGPGYHVLNSEGYEVCWVFEQMAKGTPHEQKIDNYKRAKLIADAMNRNAKADASK
jgi:hypothetical protein